MKKKLFAGLLMVLVTMFVSITAFALTDGEWEFQLLDDEVTITGYLGDSENVVIPSTIFGAPVTKVECSTYGSKNFSKVKSLEYPGTVKEIKDNGVGKNLERVIFNEGTEIIDGFVECNKLQSVHFPSTVKEIGYQAFQWCSSLSSINLHSGIEKIDYCAFLGTAITELDLSVLSDNCTFGKNVFQDCTSLKSVKFRTSEKNIAYGMFAGCTALENVEFSNGVTEIGTYAFKGCTSLSQIILPTSLRTIDDYAFQSTGLKEVVIPYGVTKLGSTVFNYNKDLK